MGRFMAWEVPLRDSDPLVRTDAAGAIDQDLFCLTCGYNLRGLAGDPIRCPECGNPNDLGAAAIPAELIARSMRSMETAPTNCSGCAFAFFVLTAPFWFMDRKNYFCISTIAIPATLGWIPSYFGMKRVYENRSGWKRILIHFHVATFCCAAGVPAFWLITALRIQARGPTGDYGVILIVIVATILFILGLRIYRGAQRRIGSMQRDTAVRMAGEILRRERTWEMMRNER